MAANPSTPGPELHGNVHGIDELEFRRRLTALFHSVVPDGDPRYFQLGAYVQRTAARMRADMDRELRLKNISGAHIRVLVALGAVGPTTPSELARLTQVTPPTMSGLLETLRRSEHIVLQTQHEPADRRSKIVALSEKGTATLHEQLRANQALEETWAKTLTQRQLDSILFLLDRFAAKMED